MPKLPDDPRFAHVTYHHTDLTRTFARIRRELKEEAERKAALAEIAQSADEAIKVEVQRKVRALKGAR